METQSRPWFVAIGASGGRGLDDIKELLAALPGSLPAIVLIVLHRSWNRESQLQSVLSRISKLRVVTAIEDEQFRVGTAYIGKPAEHLTLAAKSFGKLVDDPDRQYGNRTVDLLFNSVAAHGGNRTIGVILSGSLDDGSRGLSSIHHAGGLTMALVPNVPPKRGMPENAIDYDGPIDFIGNPCQIASAICSAVEKNQPETDLRADREV